MQTLNEYLKSLPKETLKALTRVRVLPVSPVSADVAATLTTTLRFSIEEIISSKP